MCCDSSLIPVDKRAKSLSSSFMTGITLYRNDQGILNKIHAQLGYFLVFVCSLVESVVAAIFFTLSLIFLPVSQEPKQRCFSWLKSSTFTIGWSFFDFWFNPFAWSMVADEKSAWYMCTNGSFVLLPPDALR